METALHLLQSTKEDYETWSVCMLQGVEWSAAGLFIGGLAYMLGRIFHSNVQPVLPVNPTCLEIFKFESCITKPRAESHSLDLNKYVLYWPRRHRIKCSSYRRFYEDDCCKGSCKNFIKLRVQGCQCINSKFDSILTFEFKVTIVLHHFWNSSCPFKL